MSEVEYNRIKIRLALSVCEKVLDNFTSLQFAEVNHNYLENT
jgi:hypothetical protein